MALSKIMRGTMLLTGATLLSKILGILYVIPFNSLVGLRGGALFFYAYNPYNILISISTLGVPLAVSKFVSKYNALGDYQTGRRMYKSGLLLMAITGIVAFLVLYFSAGMLAAQSISDDDFGNTIEDVKMVIQMVSFALLIIPGMSLVRGFFQGYESMGPTAISQVVEQIVRIVFLLTGVYLVLKVFHGSLSFAVGLATFAAFIGGLASCVVLWIYWKRRKPYLDKQLEQQTTESNIPMSSLFKELLSYAGPFVLVGIATPLYQQIDQLTFNHAMADIGLNKIAAGFTSEDALAAINFYGHKLVIIPVTIATGLSLAILPAITKSFIDKQEEKMFSQINQSLQIIMLLILPAVVGMSLLANEAYTGFFGLENIQYTGPLLRWYAPVALLYALFTVSSSILQGINQQRFAVISLTIGLVIKIAFNTLLIHTFGAKGAIIGTGLAVLAAVLLNLWRIKVSIQFSLNQIIKRSALIAIFTFVMVLVVLLVRWLLHFGITYQNGQLTSALIVLIAAAIGGYAYLWLCYKSSLLERVLGNRLRFLDRLFKFTK